MFNPVWSQTPRKGYTELCALHNCSRSKSQLSSSKTYSILRESSVISRSPGTCLIRFRPRSLQSSTEGKTKTVWIEHAIPTASYEPSFFCRRLYTKARSARGMSQWTSKGGFPMNSKKSSANLFTYNIRMLTRPANVPVSSSFIRFDWSLLLEKWSKNIVSSISPLFRLISWSIDSILTKYGRSTSGGNWTHKGPRE